LAERVFVKKLFFGTSELFDIGLKSWSGNVGSVRIDEGVDNRLAIHCFIWKNELQQDMIDWDSWRCHGTWMDGVW